MKKVILKSVIGLLLLTSVLICWPKEKTDVVLTDFSENSESILQINIDTMTPATYVGSMSIKQNGESLYCSFKSTFGWPANQISAKDCFELNVENIKNIFFNRPNDKFELVLTKDENNLFQKVKLQNDRFFQKHPIKKY